MPFDPHVNPLIVFPTLAALLLAFCLLWLGGADIRLRRGAMVAIGLVIVAFLVSRTPLF